METLTPDVAEEVADFITCLECPLYDRHDLLRDAAALACVGNSGATLISHAIFTYLSPRLGQPIPNDLTEASTATQLKALCKEWGLATGGRKGELWQRIIDEVEDSEEVDGEPPTHCLVSAATRRELVAHKTARVSASRAKEAYGLSNGTLKELPHIEGPLSKGMLGGYPTRLYLISDVKRRARHDAALYSRDKSWERKGRELAAALQYKASDAAKQARAKAKKDTAERKEQLRQALTAKGLSAGTVERLMGSMEAFEFTAQFGAGRTKTADEAANGLMELLFYSAFTTFHVHMARLAQGFTSRGSTWRQEEAATPEARRLALNDWVGQWESMQAMLDCDELPATLAGRVQEIWVAQEAAAAQAAAEKATAANAAAGAGGAGAAEEAAAGQAAAAAAGGAANCGASSSYATGSAGDGQEGPPLKRCRVE